MEIDFTPYNQILQKEDKSLYEHQKSAIKFLLTRKKCLLADDQGLGKSTSAAIASIEGKFNKILIISPASIKSTWKRELKRFVPEEEIGIIESTNWFNDKKYNIINYDIVDLHYKVPYQEVETIKNKIDKKTGETIEQKVIKKVKSRKKDVIEQAMNESDFMIANFDLIIIDECHKLSKNDSIRYNVIMDFIKRSKIENVFLLSGTPMTNRPLNLYHVLALIDHPVTHNFDYYVNTYCDGRKINTKEGKQITLKNGATNLDELMEKVKDCYLRREKKDIPGMVNKSIHQRYYDLTKEEKFEYDTLWDEYEQAQLYIGKNNLIRELTEGIFLRQFVAKSMIKNTIKLIDEFLEDDEKVFIACCFDEEIAMLKEYYGDKAVVYKGGMTTKQKDNAEDKFMNDKNTKVFIGNVIAAGVGLTLTSSHICIFNSYDWVPGNNVQMMDRIHRIGQNKDVEVYFQLYSNTISEHMWETIIKKQLNINTVIKEEKDK